MFAEPAVWRLPLVERHLLERLMRRYAQAGGRQNLLTCTRLLQMAPEASHAKKLFAGFEQAFAGRSLAGLPDELVKAMAARGGASLALRLRLGEETAVEEALKLVGDGRAAVKDRLPLLQVLGEVKQTRAVPILLQVVGEAREAALRQAALAALQPYDDPSIGAAVVRLHDALPHDVREAAHTLLLSRKSWTRQLLEAVAAGKIDRKGIPLDVVRRMTLHRDEGIEQLVRQFWGKVQGVSTAEMRVRLDRYEKVVRGGSGSPYQGKKLFEASCARCHTLFGKGGQVGPDLTSYKRDDLSNMLLSIVNPSAEIREGFETHLILTGDGRALTGFVVERDNRVVVLRSADGQDLRLERGNIEEMRVVPQSLMPEGLLDGLSEQQVRDLFAYLRSTQPLNE
jgi:putative heme-binding domain-containing protein